MKRNVAVGTAIAAVVVLVAAYLGATAWGGRKVETRYRQQVADSLARYPFLKVGAQSYERGFFKATSSTAVQIGCAAEPAKPPPELIVTSTIRHGPFVDGKLAAAVVDSEISVSGEAGQQLAKVFSGPPLKLHTVVGFGGEASGTLQGPPARLSSADGDFAWQGLSGTFELSADRKTFAYHLQSPGGSVGNSRQGLTIKIGAIDVQSDGRLSGPTGLIRTGKSQGSVASFELAMTGAPPAQPFNMQLTGMKMSGDTSIDGDLLSSKASFSAAGVVAGAKLDRIESQMSFKRLHAPTYQHMMDGIAKVSTQCDASRGAAPGELMAAMQTDLMTILQYDPELALDKLAVDYDGKRGEMSYSIGVLKMTKEEAQQPPALLMMTKVKAKAQARIPLAWVQQLAKSGAERMQGAGADPAMFDVMIDKAVADGYVVRDGEYLASKIELAGGEMTVNGKVLSPGGAGQPGVAPPPPPPSIAETPAPPR